MSVPGDDKGFAAQGRIQVLLDAAEERIKIDVEDRSCHESLARDQRLVVNGPRSLVSGLCSAVGDPISAILDSGFAHNGWKGYWSTGDRRPATGDRRLVAGYGGWSLAADSWCLTAER
jgi:hypothetical protein